MMDVKIECPLGPSDECSFNVGGNCMMSMSLCLGMTRAEIEDEDGDD